MPAMTCFIILTRKYRGNGASDAYSALARKPGRTVVQRPSAASVPCKRLCRRLCVAGAYRASGSRLPGGDDRGGRRRASQGAVRRVCRTHRGADREASHLRTQGPRPRPFADSRHSSGPSSRRAPWVRARCARKFQPPATRPKTSMRRLQPSSHPRRKRALFGEA